MARTRRATRSARAVGASRPAVSLRRDVDEQIAQAVFHRVPVELDVVIAVDDREPVAGGDEVGERVEDDAVPLDDGASSFRPA